MGGEWDSRPWPPGASIRAILALAVVAILAMVPDDAAASKLTAAELVVKKVERMRGYEDAAARCRRVRPGYSCRYKAELRKKSGTFRRCRGRATVAPRSPFKTTKRRCGRRTPYPWPRYGFNGVTTPDGPAIAAGAGANTNRMFVRWSMVEDRPGAYYWKSTDAAYKRMIAAGTPPLLVLVAAPDWAGDHAASCSGEGCYLPPAQGAEGAWAAFAGAAAARYPGALGIEIWNEPNWGAAWGPAPDPARYVTLARLARDAIKAAAPRMPVVLGGLVPAQSVAGVVVNPDRFLKRVYEAGGDEVFDAIGVHSYPDLLTGSYLSAAKAQIEPVIKVAEAHDAPVWVTEAGISTTGPSHVAATPEQQAHELGVLYEWMRKTGRIDVMIVHKLIDGEDPVAGLWGFGFGLLTLDGAVKPAYCALALVSGKACSPPPGLLG